MSGPGPGRKKGNQFELLAEHRDSFLFEPSAAKKMKSSSTSNFPLLPNVSNLKNPRFILISPKDEKKQPLSEISVFILNKAIDGVSKEYENISLLRDGNILILTKSQSIADKFLKISNLGQVPVTVTLHSSLNSSKGIVYAPCLINIKEEEIVNELKQQGVTDVYKFQKKTDNGMRPSGLMLFTFDRYNYPPTIDIAWYKTKVQEYIPNPMRCKNCQILGHTAKRCTNKKICEICSLLAHENLECTQIKCANCSNDHASSSKTCPKYLQSKEILTIKTRNKCSMGEAKRIYGQQNLIQSNLNSQTYASRAREAQNIQEKNIPSKNLSNSTKNKNMEKDIQITSTSTNNSKTTPITTNSITKPKITSESQPNSENATKATTDSIIPKIPHRPLPPRPDTHNKNPQHTSHNQSSQLSTTTYNSPISKITNTEIENKTYFMSTSDNDDNE
ncbi:uncharacterized protein LOC129950665 [Eupeodes corollae]|uniref:uncharacterized protein LOC129950665 n=1 Tax=Eupeodes corollae TaxID=290404 RepID=UPI00249014F7|nr:uncharacterized protein LOC129950665 [Eupeodes corollae]